MTKLRVILPAIGLCLALCVIVAQSQGPQDRPTDSSVRYDFDKVVRVTIRSDEDLEAMKTVSDDVWSHSEGVGEVDYLVPDENMAALDALDIPYRTLIDDVQLLVDRSFESGDARGGFFSDYKTYAELHSFYDGLQGQHPELVSSTTIGQSVENRDIRAYVITGPTGSNKPQLVYQYLQHAREWITGMSGAYLADQLVQGYGSDPYITALMDKAEFHIIPVLNPDGYVYSWGPDRLWRKNRRNNGGGIYGVDLNRNWDADWGGVGASSNPSDPTYHGPSVFSEPETSAVRDYVASLSNVEAFNDTHCYSQLVLTPYGYTDQLPFHHPEFLDLGGSVAGAMNAIDGKSFIFGPIWTTIYPASGGAEDWAYDFAINQDINDPTWSISFELRDTGQFGFLLPPEQIVVGAQESTVGALRQAEWVVSSLDFDFPNGLPTFVSPDSPETIDVELTGRTGSSYQTGTGKLWWRVGSSGAFQSAPFIAQGGNLYEVDLPTSACGDTLEYYFEAETTDGAVHTSPFVAPGDVNSASVASVTMALDDDFESNQGWTVVNENLSDGPWGRGIPANGDRGDPPADFDGSGRCYVTDNVAGNSDVDGGPTRLVSPVLDLSAGDAAVIEYAYWMYCDDGDDTMVVEVSDNGGSSWTTARTYIGGGGGWQQDSFLITDFVAATTQNRVRVSVADQPNDSVTEAGFDAFRAYTSECDPSGSIVFTQTVLTRGEDATFTVTGAEPGTDVYFFYTKRGEGAGPCDPFFGGLCFDLIGPIKQFMVATADGSGVAEKIKTVPANAPLREFHTQAVNLRGVGGSESVKSNVNRTIVLP